MKNSTIVRISLNTCIDGKKLERVTCLSFFEGGVENASCTEEIKIE